MLKKINDFVDHCLKVLFIDFFHLSFLEKRWNQMIQFIKFGIVGISNTVISYLVYLVGISFGMHYLVASVLGFIISILNSFYWNNRYVFKLEGDENRSIARSFCKTFVAYAGTGLILNNFLLMLQIDLLQWSKTIAPLINLIITIPLNFLLNKLWAFKKQS